MGQQQNKNVQDFQPRLQERYIIQQSNEHMSYIKCKSTFQIFVLKKISLTSTNDFNQLVHEAQKQKDLKHNHILLLHDFQIISQSTFCSTFYQIYLVYEYCSHHLLAEIDIRIKQNRKFEEKEIWIILCNCTLALTYLFRNNFFYLTIDLDEIFLTKNGIVKLIHPQILPNPIPQARKIKYYSPELLKNQNLKKSQKSCVFSLAMCLMQILLLESLNDCYDYFNMKIDQGLLNQKIKKLYVQGTYSKSFLQILQRMLNINQSERFGIIELQQYLHELMQEKLKKQQQMKRNINYNSGNKKIVTHSINDSSEKVNCSVEKYETNNYIKKNSDLEQKKQKIPCTAMITELEQLPNQILLEMITYEDKQMPDDSSNSDDDEDINNNNNNDNDNDNDNGDDNDNDNNQIKKKVRVQQYQTNTTIQKPDNNYNKQFKKPQIGYNDYKGNILKSNQNTQKQLQVTQPTHHDESIYTALKKQIEEISINKEKLSAKREYQLATHRASLQHNYVTSFSNFNNRNQKRNSTHLFNSEFTTYSDYQNKFSINNFNSVATHKEQKKFVNQILPKGRYQGQKVGDYKHGFGTFYYKDGGKYIGQWFQNKMNGRGTLYYPSNKKAYQGSWKSDKLEGHGILYNQQAKSLNKFYDFRDLNKIDEFWITYQGNFKTDNKSGMGIFTLSNGQTFQGMFYNDEANGQGLFTRMNNTQVRGIWKNNILIKIL